MVCIRTRTAPAGTTALVDASHSGGASDACSYLSDRSQPVTRLASAFWAASQMWAVPKRRTSSPLCWPTVTVRSTRSGWVRSAASTLSRRPDSPRSRAARTRLARIAVSMNSTRRKSTVRVSAAFTASVTCRFSSGESARSSSPKHSIVKSAPFLAVSIRAFLPTDHHLTALLSAGRPRGRA